MRVSARISGAVLLVCLVLAVAQSAQAQAMFDPCRSDPSDLWNWQTPDPAICPMCTRYDPPQDGDGKFYDVIERTTANVKWLFDSGQLKARTASVDWTKRPRIKWLPYDFWVPGGFWRDDDGTPHTGSVCAMGLADSRYGQIVISYRNSERVASLVEWETWNFWLSRTGRTDWWDNWPRIVPDAGFVSAPRRRAAGH